jgi:NADPH2:quinone reductase
MRAIRFSAIGGPDVLALQEVSDPTPGPGQILIRHAAIGVNFIDTYHRTGLYPLALPSGLGMEAAGRVEAVGDGVERFRVGDRVGYCTGPIGAYSEAACVAADRAIAIPAGVSDALAAAGMLKGLTAQYLLKRTYPVKPGDRILVHAAAGGVGQILVQWARALGATVIAVVGSPAKAAVAHSLGAEHVIVQSTDNIAGRVRALTGGEGVPVAYDSVGRDTFQATLESLAVRGVFVSFGNASGPAPAVEPALLSAKGGLYFTRPGLAHYTRTAIELQETADDFWDALQRGLVKIATPTEHPLAEAARAHEDLEARRTTGSLILVP